MLYALYVGFFTAFIAIAATGHVLLLTAVYPNVFDTQQRDVSAAEVELVPREPPRRTIPNWLPSGPAGIRR